MAAKQALDGKMSPTESFAKILAFGFLDNSVDAFITFKQYYRKFKEEIVKSAEISLRNAQDKLNCLLTELRRRGRTEDQIDQYSDIREQNERIDLLREEFTVTKREFDELPVNYDVIHGPVTEAERKDIDQYVEFLKNASKEQLKSRGYNTELFLFNNRPQSNIFSGNRFEMPKENQHLLAMYDEFLKHELELKKNVQSLPKHLTDFSVDVQEITEDEVEGLLETDDDFKQLKERLSLIDEHTYSAKSIVGRAGERGIVYGTEKAKYPTNLVRLIIEKDLNDLWIDLMKHHEHGMRSVFVRDQENIFIAAYSRYDSKSALKNPSIFNLANRKFVFTPDQKKALFRIIINLNDVELFRNLVIENSVIDLFEYQKDRGITFFQSFLMEAGTGALTVKDELMSRVLIKHSNATILFIPTELPVEEGVDSDIYWRPSYNNLQNKVNGVVIKKGWDNLTIAAAMNDDSMFTWLLRQDADPTLCSKVIPTLTHNNRGNFQLILDNYISRRGNRGNTRI